MHDEVLVKLGSIEAKLDIVLATGQDHSARITKLERRNTYQAGFLAALGMASGGLWKFLSHK